MVSQMTVVSEQGEPSCVYREMGIMGVPLKSITKGIVKVLLFVFAIFKVLIF